jgi:threonine dehydrogenase-like Zn-dependent dehydrogenase
MSVGVHAVAKVAELKPGSNVVVFGAGPVGLLTAAAAKGLGAARVIAVGSSRTSIPLQLVWRGEEQMLTLHVRRHPRESPAVREGERPDP